MASIVYKVKAGERLTLRETVDKDTRISVDLAERAMADIKLTAAADGAQKINIKVDITHSGSDSHSRVELAGVARGDSRIDLSAALSAKPKIKGATATQDLRIMLLSPTARGAANPAQSVPTPGVAAKHSAAIYGADPDRLFALALLGIKSPDAKNLLSSALLSL